MAGKTSHLTTREERYKTYTYKINKNKR